MCPLFCHREFFCIDYVCCHFKTLSVISSDKISEDASYNELRGIGILEVLMNLIYCHELMKNINSTVVLVCQYRLVNYYLEKGFVILEHNYKQLSSVPNDVKLGIHAINKRKTDYIMSCYTAISSVKNTIKKLRIMSALHSVYQQNLYHDKQDMIDELFYQYHISLLKYIDHTVLTK